MKHQYFLQEAADADDTLLAKAVASGHVPATCLSGGVVVALAIAGNRVPCAGCYGPRDRCMGTEPTDLEEDEYAAVRDRLLHLFLGDEEPPLGK